ncbi:MAG: protein kinase domain-containing protein [Steroidobacteraceae bacterium]
MNEFRQALEAFLAGRIDLEAVKRELKSSLARQPQLAAAHGAYVEALYRGNRIAGEAYLALAQMVRAAGETDKTIFRTPRRPDAAGPHTAGADAAGQSDSAADRTRFRMPSAPPAPSAKPTAPPADATQLRARPAPGTSAVGAPAPLAVPAGADPSWSPTTGTGTGSHTGSPTGSTGGPFTGTGPHTGPSTWSDPNRWGGGRTVALVVGSVLKERFVLEEELGRGGMGIVFKARDMRMEEAQDRHPFVAVKILNEEFKRHPESLKALQREFRKAQSLAHPNVITVGDFDRDGGNVFMTMELLEGEALDRVIKRVRGSGLEKKEALRLTRDICRAMAYAHERGVVHSDFKPANAFLTREGTVKVFDFGIARAARRSDQVTGTVTLFDASTLGALTPAYASCEMIEGLDPDVRDDVYAIACVAYELLTGKHPFDRKSALQARDAKLVPDRPQGLSRTQWRALHRGLAFSRDQRSATAIELLNGLLPLKRSPAVYVGAGAAILAAVVVAAVVVPGQIERYREQRWLVALRSGTAARVETVLPVLDSMSRDSRDAILADRDARGGLITYYDGLIRRSESRGDYDIADESAKRLLRYLPDYADAQRISERVTSDINDEIKRQSDRFDRDLAQGRLIPAQGAENIEAVLAAVRRIDPKHPLLHDPRLPGAFAAQTRLALQGSNPALAQQLISSGLELAPSDPSLRDLRDQVRTTVLAQQRATEVANLERSLTALLATRPALSAFGSHRNEMTQLRTDAPGSAVLARVQQYAQGEIERQVRDLAGRHGYANAQSLLARYADLASAAFIEGQREQVDNARLASQNKAADEARLREQRVAQLKGSLDALVRRGPGDDATSWDANVRDEEGKLSAYLAASDPYFAQVRTATAAAYLQKTDQLLQAQRLTEAGAMLERARAYGPQPAQMAREEQLLATARVQQATQAKARERLAQIQALEQKLLDEARANTVNDALVSLASLKQSLPANDAFLTKDAPNAIGRSYLRLASNAARDGRFDEAASLTGKGRAAVPGYTALASAQQRFERYASLDREMASVSAASAGRVRSEIDSAARLAPDEAGALRQNLARALVTRVRAIADPSAAEPLKAVARSLFPDDALVARAFPVARAAPASRTAPRAPVSARTEAQAPRAPVTAGPLVARVTEPRKPAPIPAPVPAPAARPTSLHDCRNPELLGMGANPRASCWDEIAGGRGPLLVVVPAPPNGHPFAIGRYELSNSEFARYCTATGKCRPNTLTPDLPVTSISLQEAQSYLTWLSRETGAVYRLPSSTEWLYAAEAGAAGGGHQDANCEKPGVSVSMLPVSSGAHNAWGLYNFDGNAQEWVRSAGAVQARGGAYTDSFSQCTPEKVRAQSGAPDAITGFRVLREVK